MTVAAVVLAASSSAALFDAAGRPAARRITELAWAGGAVPVVVVAADADGAVAQALAGSPAELVTPTAPEDGPVGQFVHGIRAAAEAVSGTEAALLWPARLVWVDAETVTSLIEAHGVDPEPVLRPSFRGDVGWPVLFPLRHLPALESLSAVRPPDELLADLEAQGITFRAVELGDPGVVHDRDTPIDALPAYEGPPEPAGGPPPDWGPSVADAPDEPPTEGQALPPYGQAADADRA